MLKKGREETGAIFSATPQSLALSFIQDVDIRHRLVADRTQGNISEVSTGGDFEFCGET